MTARAMKLLPLLVALSSATVQAQTPSTNCSTSQWTFDEFSEKLKISDECMEALAAQWTENQTADAFSNLNRLADVLKKTQKAVCKDATPKECPAPAVQSKGGLVCVSADGNRFCKPMCNERYDFGFLRISRLFETCGNTTGYTWTTQYVGGNKLAVCNKSNVRVAGASSAYFPANQDCWTTKSNSVLEQEIINAFVIELSTKNINGPYTQSCLMCG
ncbi:uncharacterized protein si:ch1073-126c3.2 isoform X2 [Tachysurus vachellii]|uniref:uncharacterized protein si:ch1073-126c3.2 isoform X2 n=1 Tax=Tachysurus vachellii TaxID=175792 RepID=UPI00296AC32E|nr:uncharacterized protein si:ch1073-126c3.2 isoform X2 [Tachysurus vachellii]XP_060727727.1 uncharacterized protein si:ch1073-126c3.2 isoform X2 [Tachysurus vachellii]